MERKEKKGREWGRFLLFVREIRKEVKGKEITYLEVLNMSFLPRRMLLYVSSYLQFLT